MTTHCVKGGPFVLFCDHPLHAWDETDDACLSLRTRGVADIPCRVRLIPTGRKPLPTVYVRDEPGNTLAVRTTDAGHAEFDAPADCYVEVRWGGHRERARQMLDRNIGNLTTSPIITRFAGNPVLKDGDIPYAPGLVYNGSVIKYEGRYVMLVRVE